MTLRQGRPMPQNDSLAYSNATVAGRGAISPADKRPETAARTGAEARRKCFVVDDEPGIRKVFYAALGGCDLELSGFGSAQELLGAWRPEHPDIIFLDIALGQADAIAV